MIEIENDIHWTSALALSNGPGIFLDMFLWPLYTNRKKKRICQNIVIDMRGGFKGHMKTSESLGRPQKGLGGQERPQRGEWLGGP